MSLLASLFLAPALLLCQDPAPTAAPVRAQPQPLFELWIDDASTMLGSPKDAGLLLALSMLDARVIDLLGELEGQLPPLPPEMIPVVTHILTGRKSLRVFEADPNAPFPVVVQFEMQEKDAEAAQKLANTIFSFLDESGAPLSAPAEFGLRQLEMPDGPPVRIGVVGRNFVVCLGRPVPGAGAARSAGLPDGARPWMSMHLDLGRVVNMLTQLAPMSQREADEFAMMMDTFGLGRFVLEGAAGADANGTHSVIRMPGYAGTMRGLGVLPKRGLTAADLAMVPTDAEWAQVTTLNLHGVVDLMVEMLAEPLSQEGIEDPIAMIKEEIGIDLLADVVDHIGSSFAIYSSRSTGGGGMLSTAAALELTNSAALLATFGRVQEMINELGRNEANGYVRVRSWKHGKNDLFTLTFPGLPVPLELTLGFAPKHLVAGITPQAALGALGQLERTDGGLGSNAAFLAQAPRNPIGSYGVTYIDTPTLAAKTYGLTSLACSAIANMMRSPSSTREPGAILPQFDAFLAGARPIVGVAVIEGDDYAEYGRSDQSMLVNVAGSIGMLASSPLALLFVTGVAGGFMGRSFAYDAGNVYTGEDDYPIEWDEVTEPVDPPAPVEDEDPRE